MLDLLAGGSGDLHHHPVRPHQGQPQDQRQGVRGDGPGEGGGDILLRGGVNKEILFCGSKSFRYKHRNIAKLFKSVILC